MNHLDDKYRNGVERNDRAFIDEWCREMRQLQSDVQKSKEKARKEIQRLEARGKPVPDALRLIAEKNIEKLPDYCN